MSEILLLEQNEHGILVKLIRLDRWKIESCGKVCFDKDKFFPGKIPHKPVQKGVKSNDSTQLLLVTLQPVFGCCSLPPATAGLGHKVSLVQNTRRTRSLREGPPAEQLTLLSSPLTQRCDAPSSWPETLQSAAPALSRPPRCWFSRGCALFPHPAPYAFKSWGCLLLSTPACFLEMYWSDSSFLTFNDSGKLSRTHLIFLRTASLHIWSSHTTLNQPLARMISCWVAAKVQRGVQKLADGRYSKTFVKRNAGCVASPNMLTFRISKDHISDIRAPSAHAFKK